MLALRARQLGDGGCIVADIRKTFGYPLDHRSSMRSAAVLADDRESPLIHRCLPRREFLRISGLMRRYSVDHPIDKRGPISASHHLPDYTVRLFTITEVAEVLRIPISWL